MILCSQSDFMDDSVARYPTSEQGAVPEQAAVPLIHRLLRRPFRLILFIIALVMTVQSLFRRHTEWSDVYMTAARQLVTGQDIYHEGTKFVYPPFSALFTVPFLPFSEPLSQALLAMLSFAA